LKDSQDMHLQLEPNSSSVGEDLMMGTILSEYTPTSSNVPVPDARSRRRYSGSAGKTAYRAIDGPGTGGGREEDGAECGKCHFDGLALSAWIITVYAN
jgi:hypothetical protein